MSNRKLYQLASISFFTLGIIHLLVERSIRSIFPILLGISFMVISRNTQK